MKDMTNPDYQQFTNKSMVRIYVFEQAKYLVEAPLNLTNESCYEL